MKNCILILFFILNISECIAQSFTRKDSLQGGLRFERTCFDVQHYDLNISINPDEKFLKGYNKITFIITEQTEKIQLDLFENMMIDSIIFNNKKLKYTRDNNAVFITFPKPLKKRSREKLTFYYSGYPLEAKNAPWDGGFVFSEDNEGNHFIGVAVQKTGASLWYPVKDHQSDEPEGGAAIKVAVPNGLMNVSNGRFKGKVDLKNGYTRWDWEVKNPINNYNITVNIGNYARIHEMHNGLDLNYYVLKNNVEKAKKHFEEVKPMLDCFEQKFGKYPFHEDGYKLVETPYVGMEHQTAIAYGNKYQKGYLGSDTTKTGIGLLFDFIIIHETAHEWFGNSITASDIADMWIHEAFTTYAESVFVECRYGYETALKYLHGQSRNVTNKNAVIGIFGVNKPGSTDMYYKGAQLLNTLRHIVNDDDKWWKMLLKFSETYKKKIIDGNTVISFFNKEAKMKLDPIFEQYLKHTHIPLLQIMNKESKLYYRWKTDVTDFKMPVEILINNNSKILRLYPTNEWQFLNNINYDYTKTSIKLLTDKFYAKLEQTQSHED